MSASGLHAHAGGWFGRMCRMGARAYQTHRYYHQAESLSWWSSRGTQSHISDPSKLCGKKGFPIRFLSYQACKSLKIFWLDTMERQKHELLPTCKNLGLAKMKVRVTNFCKSVKFLYINELSAKNVKMSKMSAKKTFLHAYAHTCAYIHAYIHTHTCARK